jgi:23S rRNA (uracil1939-C5)-methyltransferase
VKVGDVVRLTIADLDDDGAGVGLVAGLARDRAPPVERATLEVHIAGALPGEDITARIDAVSTHRPVAWGALGEIHRASEQRVPPACLAYGRCGGCVLQHLAYPAQLAWKEAALHRQVAAFTGASEFARLTVAPVVASPRQLGYRNKSKLVAAAAQVAAKVEVEVEVEAGAELVLGAYSPRSHEVVSLSGCAIAEPPLDAVARSVAQVAGRWGVSAYDERRATGVLRHVVLRASARGQVQVTLVTATPELPRARELVADLLRRHPQIAGVIQNVNPTRGNVIFGAEERTLWGASTLDDVLAGLELRLSSRAFFQANRDVASAAYAAIARAMAIGARDTVVDAYAGVGGIALTLARGARRVVGIESHVEAVADATANAVTNGLSNVRFVAGDVAAHLAALGQADIVVLNPPRKGCEARVLQQTAALEPRRIAYLSCAPRTLLRDLAILRGLGYRTDSLTPFDMLPHTSHLEVLAVLTRSPDHAALVAAGE